MPILSGKRFSFCGPIYIHVYGNCKSYQGLKVIYGSKEKCFACRNSFKFSRCIAETKQLYSTTMPILSGKHFCFGSPQGLSVIYHYCLN